MAFIRKRKNKSGNASYQVVQSYRQDGRVRQRVLACLMYSPTISGAIATLERRIADERGSYSPQSGQRVQAMRQQIEKLKRVLQETGLEAAG